MRFLDVAQQIPLANERFAALAAAERLFAGVRSSVRHQMALGDEVLGAQVAAKGTLGFDALVMAALVEQQIALQREGFAALVALVRTFAGVAATETTENGATRVDEHAMPNTWTVASMRRLDRNYNNYLM